MTRSPGRRGAPAGDGATTAHVSSLTGGNSLLANLALLENNARLGAQIAVALAGS